MNSVSRTTIGDPWEVSVKSQIRTGSARSVCRELSAPLVGPQESRAGCGRRPTGLLLGQCCCQSPVHREGRVRPKQHGQLEVTASILYLLERESDGEVTGEELRAPPRLCAFEVFCLRPPQPSSSRLKLVKAS